MYILNIIKKNDMSILYIELKKISPNLKKKLSKLCGECLMLSQDKNRAEAQCMANRA
jgi:hypothetical protein